MTDSIKRQVCESESQKILDMPVAGAWPKSGTLQF